VIAFSPAQHELTAGSEKHVVIWDILGDNIWRPSEARRLPPSLREAGPDVGASLDLIGGLAIAVVNRGRRPFLAKWHPLLQTWTAQRDPKVSPKAYELRWSEERTLRAELETLREELGQYADALATIAGVKQEKRGLYV
jgi:hypothetical protein